MTWNVFMVITAFHLRSKRLFNIKEARVVHMAVFDGDDEGGKSLHASRSAVGFATLT
jgi:hypothetical protein